jgi:hypothetical protein
LPHGYEECCCGVDECVRIREDVMCRCLCHLNGGCDEFQSSVS